MSADRFEAGAVWATQIMIERMIEKDFLLASGDDAANFIRVVYHRILGKLQDASISKSTTPAPESPQDARSTTGTGKDRD